MTNYLSSNFTQMYITDVLSSQVEHMLKTAELYDMVRWYCVGDDDYEVVFYTLKVFFEGYEEYKAKAWYHLTWKELLDFRDHYNGV